MVIRRCPTWSPGYLAEYPTFHLQVFLTRFFHPLIVHHLGQLLASFFLISGLSYRTTFNRELRISNFPLYSI